MATQTKSISGTTVTYVITDIRNNTITVTATTTPNGIDPSKGIGITTSANGALADAVAMLSQLVLLLFTGLQP